MNKPAPRVLIIDDEPRILAALQRSLRREGYEIQVAEGPREGLRALAESEFDVVLSDHRMPRISGLDVLAEAARTQPRACLFLVTGWPDSVPQSQLQKLGVVALVPKPWDDAALKETLRKALGL